MASKSTVNINKNLDKRLRTKKLEIFCEVERNGEYLIHATREVVLVDKVGPNEKVYDTAGANGEKTYRAQKKLSEITGISVTLPAPLGGLTLTGAQVCYALELLVDAASAARDAEAEAGTS